jgi:hypothetical protein
MNTLYNFCNVLFYVIVIIAFFNYECSNKNLTLKKSFFTLASAAFCAWIGLVGIFVTMSDILKLLF